MPSYLEWSSLSALLPFFSDVPGGDGNLDTDQFWGMLVKEQNLSLDILSVTQGTRAKGINRARMLQEKAAGMLLTLQILAWSLEKMNTSFKKRIDRVARRQGLGSLPDEILSHILGSVTSVFTEALGLSQVCSRFRKVMLDSPRIWANCTLSTGMNLRQSKALVLRSRNCPLKIDIGLHCHFWNRHVKYLFSLKDRIEELEFQWLSDDEGVHVSRQYPGFQMANLRKLTINDEYSLLFSHDFYVSWSLPNLKCLGFTNFIPKPVFRQNLSYCHMKFTVGFQPKTLKLFLQSLISLETLEIELVDINDVADEDSDSDDDDDGNNDSVQDDWSSRIAIFSFSVIGSTLISHAKHVLETVRLSVTKMAFTVVFSKSDGCPGMYLRRNFLLDSLRRFPVLKNLHLHFSAPNADSSLDFSQILLRMPRSLENLQMKVPGQTLYMPVCDHTAPKLRALHFSNCDKMDIGFLTAVRDVFLCDNVVIGKVEVVGCRLIDEETLRDAFPTSKVVWIP